MVVEELVMDNIGFVVLRCFLGDSTFLLGAMFGASLVLALLGDLVVLVVFSRW